jgi:hypothetical protein
VGANEISHSFVTLVGNPDRRELAGPQSPGERKRVSTVRLNPVARLSWDQRRSDNHAIVAKRLDEPVEAVTRGAGRVFFWLICRHGLSLFQQVRDIAAVTALPPESGVESVGRAASTYTEISAVGQ